MKIFHFLFIAMIFFYGPSFSQEQETKMESRLVVSFISKGAGIDRTSLKEFETLVESFNKKSKNKITYNSKSWGREGERDFCFPSGQGRKLEKLVNQINKNFKEKELIRLKENANCKD